MRRIILIALALLCAHPAQAEVFHSRESALRLAFPGADRVEKRDVFLTRQQAARAAAAAGSELPSQLVTLYTAWTEGVETGHAMIETHTVRTLPETIIVVVGTDWRIRGVHILAFHEPPEYAPMPAWLAQFNGRALGDALRLRGDIAGITGATLTANSVTAAVRRALATCQVAAEAVAQAGRTHTPAASTE